MVRSLHTQLRGLGQILLYFSLFGLGLTLGVCSLAYFQAGEIYDYQDTIRQENLPEVDAIVCLGGGRGRIAAAGELWNRYWEAAHQSNLNSSKIPILYFSGMGHQVSWTLLSKQIRHGLSQKIRSQDVVIERESSNTDENAQWLARYAQEHHWKSIILMTSSYHMKRARYIFDHVLKMMKNPMEIETVSVYQEPFAPKEWRTGPNGIRVTLVEYLKWVYYRNIWRSF